MMPTGSEPLLRGRARWPISRRDAIAASRSALAHIYIEPAIWSNGSSTRSGTVAGLQRATTSWRQTTWLSFSLRRSGYGCALMSPRPKWEDLAMRGISLFYSLGVSLTLVIGASTDADAQTTALRGARVIDGRGGAPIDNATILIRGGRIVAIGSASGTPIPNGAEVVNYTGKTIIPGLISDHSHVGIFVGLKAAPENYNRDSILRQLKQLEAYGVTTVMALGLNGPLFYELRPELHAGRLPGADLFGADQGIGVVGGQPSAAVVPVGENQVSRPDTVEMARESIRQMATRKTDMVKIWLDSAGGLMPKLKPEVYSAVIDEAHKNGLRVAAHIYDLDDAKAVVRAGVDIIAHGVRDKPVDSEFIDLMKAQSVWYIPTIVLDYTNFVFADQPSWTREPFFQRALHPAVRAQLN